MMIPLKRFFTCTLLLLFFACFAAEAQIAQEAKGIIYRKISNDRLSGVLVTNLNNKILVMSDERGDFNIKAVVGDTLQFTKTDYTPQKMMVTGYGLIIYMQPEIKLGEVAVRGQTKRQELNEVMGQYRSRGTFYNGKPPALSFLTNPITGVYELFGKNPGRAKRFANFAKRELEAGEVDRRYNRPLVMRTLSITDTVAAQKFMDYYRPAFEDLKVWGDYELIKHIKTNYEYYRKNGDKADMQKLY